jgi:hypothetical protein
MFATLASTCGSQSSPWHRPDPSGRSRDCLFHNPSTLRIETQLGHLTLTDGQSWLASFDNQTDATNALALARRYDLLCFIGRHPSSRPGVTVATHAKYMLNYWDDPTDAETTIAPETCTRYEPSRLRAEDHGEAGWIVTDDHGLTLTLDNTSDAAAALGLARQYTWHCTIGRNDFWKSSSRLDYWK